MIGDSHVNIAELYVLISCVSPAYMNALETMALTEKQQKVQVWETQSGKNNVGSWES